MVTVAASPLVVVTCIELLPDTVTASLKTCSNTTEVASSPETVTDMLMLFHFLEWSQNLLGVFLKSHRFYQ